MTPEVRSAQAALAAYLAEPGRTQLALAKESGIPQYTISKFLSGRIKSLTPDVKIVMNIANIGITYEGARLTGDTRIQRALAVAWDGTEQGAGLLARAIEALGPVLREVGANTKSVARRKRAN